jgi:hypothetical protein
MRRPKSQFGGHRCLAHPTLGPMVVRSSNARVLRIFDGDCDRTLLTLILQGSLAFSDIIECLSLAHK